MRGRKRKGQHKIRDVRDSTGTASADEPCKQGRTSASKVAAATGKQSYDGQHQRFHRLQRRDAARDMMVTLIELLQGGPERFTSPQSSFLLITRPAHPPFNPSHFSSAVPASLSSTSFSFSAPRVCFCLPGVACSLATTSLVDISSSSATPLHPLLRCVPTGLSSPGLYRSRGRLSFFHTDDDRLEQSVNDMSIPVAKKSAVI